MSNPNYDWWDGLGDRNACAEASQQARKQLKLLLERFEKVPNKNYEAGRRFEYERKKHYEGLGWSVVRTAGSHGEWDLVCTDWRHGVVTHVQCKVVKSQAEATRMAAKFRLEPPFEPRRGLHQRLDVKVKGSREVLSVTV